MTTGPLPKRSDERRRRNKPVDGGEVAQAPAGDVPVMPDPDPSWHVMARDWYTSLNGSGQKAFYQASDWQTARVWAELLSRQLSSGRPSAQMIAAWAAAATELLTTEGARRRARVELERHQVDEDEAAAEAAVIQLVQQHTA